MNGKFSLKQAAKMAAQNVVLPQLYRRYRKLAVRKNEIIFADAHHDSRPESMELLYRRLAADPRFEVKEMYLNFARAGAAAQFRYCAGFMKEYAQAGFVILCDNFLPAASCRKKALTRVIQLWHACGALKKFGYDSQDDIPRGYRGNVFRNIDLMTVSSEACRKPFARATRLPLTAVRAPGVSRTDCFFDTAWREQCLQKFKEVYPQAYRDGQKVKKVVVWAPTFRGNAGNPTAAALDLEKLKQDLGDGYLVIASLHPHMAGRFRIESSPLATDELFPAADIMIADYSSVIFEYLLFDRPLILYTQDYEEYAARRGFYMDYSEIPGRQVRRGEDLADAIRTAQNDEKKRRQFLEKYMSRCDGHATERIYRRIVNYYES